MNFVTNTTFFCSQESNLLKELNDQWDWKDTNGKEDTPNPKDLYVRTKHY